MLRSRFDWDWNLVLWKKETLDIFLFSQWCCRWCCTLLSLFRLDFRYSRTIHCLSVNLLACHNNANRIECSCTCTWSEALINIILARTQTIWSDSDLRLLHPASVRRVCESQLERNSRRLYDVAKIAHGRGTRWRRDDASIIYSFLLRSLLVCVYDCVCVCFGEDENFHFLSRNHSHDIVEKSNNNKSKNLNKLQTNQ